ncbi:NAD(P)-dependent oxidoreductase [Gottfriedia luciferensis]|uniref:NAD(P)-dependent oxidoreductase n=1 Tax=Gottfriedia luciferensis TaxID=178774 RepID=UPI000B42F35D|nr:NAD(P)H-binding protein [Gottfriedia luciferensis]
MKILLLGATGRVGSFLVNLLLEAKIELVLLVRDESKITIQHDLLTVLSGNTLNVQDLQKATENVNGVISALNTDGVNTLSRTMELLIPLLEKKNINRIVTIGTAGILQSRLVPSALRYLSPESKRKSTTAAIDHERAYQSLKASQLNWTVVCPTYLPDGPIRKKYRLEKKFLPLDGKSISTGDTAYFAFKEFFECKYNRTRVGISY